MYIGIHYSYDRQLNKQESTNNTQEHTDSFLAIFFLNMFFFYSLQCITFENIIPENETSIEAVELCKLILGDLIRRFCK